MRALRRLAVALPWVLTLAGGCSDGGTRDGEAFASAERADLSAYRLVDLSHRFDESTLYWPTSPSRFESETLSEGITEGGFYYLAKRFASPEHGGTHLDAPVHFAEHGWSVDEIPLERLVAPAVVIDVTAQVADDADYRLTTTDVEDFEALYGEIGEGVVVLLRTGWSRRWSDENAYFGRPEDGAPLDLHFPAYSAEAAHLLVEERHVGMLGVDTASLDHGPSTDFPVHQVANGANVPGLENVTGLDQLPPTGSWLLALPMNIGGGSGAPVRIVGLVPR